MSVGQRFRESEEYELLEPYADGGLVAGYRVEGLLSRDPWRHVTYDASMPDGRRVALKLLNVRSADSRRSRRRFTQRLRLRASIRHPHLLPILDWGTVGDRNYLAMAPCQAPTLADLLAAAPLETGRALRLLGQLADALETAHEGGVLHRDLAPDRVLVEPREGGYVLLGDFGVADPEWDSGLLDLTGSTPYLSPERLMRKPLTRESNVYSLACMLFECLTDEPPYTSEHAGMIGYAHVAEPPPRPSEYHPELPPQIDVVVAAGMAKDPSERPASARQLISMAADALGVETLPLSTNGGLPVGERLPLGPILPDDGLRSVLRRKGLVLAVTGIVVCGGAGFALGRAGHDSAGSVSDPLLAAEQERRALLPAADGALKRLDAGRAVGRRRLAAARTRPTQAVQAARLAAAYEATRRALPRRSGSGARVASALNETGGAYGRLAAAARRADRRGYAAAVRAVFRSERDLDQAILRLNRARR